MRTTNNPRSTASNSRRMTSNPSGAARSAGGTASNPRGTARNARLPNQRASEDTKSTGGATGRGSRGGGRPRCCGSCGQSRPSRREDACSQFVRRAKGSACRMQEAAALLDCKCGIVRSGGQQLEERLHQVALLLTTTLELWEGLYAELMHPEGRGEHERPRVGDPLPQRVSRALTWFLAVEDRGAAVVVVDREGEGGRR